MAPALLATKTTQCNIANTDQARRLLIDIYKLRSELLELRRNLLDVKVGGQLGNTRCDCFSNIVLASSLVTSPRHLPVKLFLKPRFGDAFPLLKSTNKMTTMINTRPNRARLLYDDTLFPVV
jgi:hypothetical protein